MLDASEAFLLGCSDKLAIADECGRRVTVKGVEAKDDQGAVLNYHALFMACSKLTGQMALETLEMGRSMTAQPSPMVP